MENWPSVWARNFQSDFFFIALGHPVLSRSTREADDKASVNKGESIKLLEPKIRLAFRNSLPIKNGTLIEAFSCFAGSNNDLSCCLACKILLNALLRLVNWQIHLPKPVYLQWVLLFTCIYYTPVRTRVSNKSNGTDRDKKQESEVRKK